MDPPWAREFQKNCLSMIWDKNIFGTFFRIGYTQHAEWDLNKTSKTLKGTPLGLIFMLYGWKKNVVWNPRLKGKFLKIPGRGIEPGTLEITTVGHPSKYWLGSTLLNFSDQTLSVLCVILQTDILGHKKIF